MLRKTIGLIALFLITLPVHAQRYRTDYRVFASAGALLGWEAQVISGINTDIDISSVPEDIIPMGGEYPFPSSALTTTVVSTSANDITYPNIPDNIK